MVTDDVKEALEQFQDYSNQWSEIRDEALKDLRFTRLSEQWEESIREDRERERKPCLTINKCPHFARQVINDARQNKPSIKIHPVDDDADPETADIMNGLVRNIEYTSDAEVAYDTALENAVYCGLGYFRISLDYASYDTFDMDIRIERISNPLSVYPDPGTTECDASDWNGAFITEMLPRDKFKSEYPEADPVDFKGDHDSDWMSEDEVRIAERWTREEENTKLLRLSSGIIVFEDQFKEYQEMFAEYGIQVVAERPTKVFRVKQEIMTAAEILETTDWPGRYIPIVPVYGEEFEVEGKRYFKSMFRDAKDAQRMFNYWRTASTEMVALAPKAPFVGAVGQFATDAKNWATANSETHPYLEYDPLENAPPPRREQPPQIPHGAIQETMSADHDMKALAGIFDPGLGDKSNERSGVAIHERKQESDVSNFHFIDNLSRGMRYAGRVLLDLIPHVYSEARVIRTINYDGSVDNVRVNQPFEQGGVQKIYDLRKGKYDLTVETGPGYTTQRQEALDRMDNMVSKQPELFAVIGDLIAKNMDWDGADEIAKRLRALLPPQIAQMENMDIPDEAKPLVAQFQQRIKQAEEAIETLKMQISEKDRAIQWYEQERNNKAEENQIKRDKIEADVLQTQMKEQGDQQLARLEARLEQQKTALQSSLEAQQKEQMAYIQNFLDQLNNQSQGIM